MIRLFFKLCAPLSEAGIGALGSAAQGAASFVTGLVGARQNLKAQREANEMNYKIAQMNNDYNVKMMERQMDYNTEMWNKSNEYNKASNQVARLREAGLNPYLMLNGGSAGSAANAMGINPPTATAVTMQPTDNGLAGVASSISQMQNPMSVYADLKNRFAEARIAESEANVAEDTQDDRILNAELQNSALRESTALTLSQRLKNDIDVAWLPTQYSLMCGGYLADIALKRSQKQLTDKQVDHEVQKIAETVARIAGIDKDNQIKALEISLRNAVFDYDVQRKKYEAEYWRNNSGFKPSGWSGFFSGLATNPELFASFEKTINTVLSKLGFDVFDSSQKKNSVPSLNEFIDDIFVSDSVKKVRRGRSVVISPSGRVMGYYDKSGKYHEL